MKLDYIIVIPARLKSVRLPRKPLVNISGIPMVIRTYSQCLKVVDKSKIFIATDSQEIIDIADKYNFNSVLTSDKALTGTDRVAEVATIIESDYYINIQGDEPIFNPDDIKLIIDSIKSFSINFFRILYSSPSDPKAPLASIKPAIPFSESLDTI